MPPSAAVPGRQIPTAPPRAYARRCSSCPALEVTPHVPPAPLDEKEPVRGRSFQGGTPPAAIARARGAIVRRDATPQPPAPLAACLPNRGRSARSPRAARHVKAKVQVAQSRHTLPLGRTSAGRGKSGGRGRAFARGRIAGGAGHQVRRPILSASEPRVHRLIAAFSLPPPDAGIDQFPLLVRNGGHQPRQPDSPDATRWRAVRQAGRLLHERAGAPTSAPPPEPASLPRRAAGRTEAAHPRDSQALEPLPPSLPPVRAAPGRQNGSRRSGCAGGDSAPRRAPCRHRPLSPRRKRACAIAAPPVGGLHPDHRNKPP